MRREAGVVDVLDCFVLLEEGRDGAGVLAMLAHAHGERLDSAQDEPGVERPGNRAERLLQEEETFCDRRVVRRGEAADHVGVSAEVLRRRVHDDVRAEGERRLQVRSGEGVVDDEDRADRVRSIGGRTDVDDVQQRIRRRLDPDHARPVVEMGGEVPELRRRDVLEDVSLRLVHLRGQAVHAAVDVRDQRDAVAGVQQVHERRRRSEPRRECDAVLGVLE